MQNGLYIVATPIGNLGDLSPRAAETLANADVIACEDTRIAKKLFALLNISTAGKKFIVYQNYNEEDEAQNIINLAVNDGKSIGQRCRFAADFRSRIQAGTQGSRAKRFRNGSARLLRPYLRSAAVRPADQPFSVCRFHSQQGQSPRRHSERSARHKSDDRFL